MTTGTWNHIAKIGIGYVRVHCTFDVSSDGDVENLDVTDGDTNITKYLCDYQIEDLEVECYDSYIKSAKQHNTDLQINNYLAGASQ